MLLTVQQYKRKHFLYRKALSYVITTAEHRGESYVLASLDTLDSLVFLLASFTSAAMLG